MIRDSVVEILTTIYVDINYTEPTKILIKRKGEEQPNTIEMNSILGIQGIFSILKSVIHPRYTRVIIDGGSIFHEFVKWIDNNYNHYIPKCEPIIMEDIMLEMVEIRNVSREEIKEWEKWL